MVVVVNKPVVDLNVRCSLVTREGAELRKRRGGGAASDTCQRAATNAVQCPDGRLRYRCDDHRGVVSVTYGPARETVPTEVND